ncbi:MAG: hypothetical protein AAF211_08625 [Myxococcota bacterium]
MLKVIFISVPMLLSLAACGTDDGDSPVETAETAETGEAPIEFGPNDWSTPCGGDLGDCPDGQSCYSPPLPDGSTTQGYCTPTCSVDADCTDGFSGPGDASCFVAPACLISCERAYTDGTCPEGLTCLPTGGPTNACGIPAQ